VQAVWVILHHPNCLLAAPLSKQLIVSVLGIVGKLGIPFTSGLLVGIGERPEHRLADLLLLHRLHQKFGHLQELIIQNFCPKPGTAMAAASAPSTESHLRTIAMARLVFGSAMNIQAPPNLVASAPQISWKQLLDAGSGLHLLFGSGTNLARRVCKLGRGYAKRGTSSPLYIPSVENVVACHVAGLCVNLTRLGMDLSFTQHVCAVLPLVVSQYLAVMW
jgi:hypothetical protein